MPSHIDEAGHTKAFESRSTGGTAQEETQLSLQLPLTPNAQLGKTFLNCCVSLLLTVK